MSMISMEEFIDLVQTDITVGGALPKNLPDHTIRQFVETRAAKWFYQNYQYAVSKMYYLIDKAVFLTDQYTNFKYVELPCEIQSISWIYKIHNQNLLQLGINVPNLSVNLGVTNQPYLSSYVTTIGELGIYKAQIDSMADMLNQMNLYTVKFHFNQLTHRLNILTNVEHHLILETYINIPLENLMVDHYFLKYVTGWAKMQQGRMLGTFNFTLPGGVTYNSSDMVANGKEEMKEVEDEIKNMTTSSWFYLVKR
ncbi:hypothetical protein EBU94_08020 [bacterium]|nr:hypothetical protein [bacterium]